MELLNGIPSHDTFNRTISAIDPRVLQERFVSWAQSIVQLSEEEVVSIDGKRLCSSGKDSKKAIIHMVSVWSDANNIVLGCWKVPDKRTGQYQQKIRYYISYLLQSAAMFNQQIRKHWSIENKQLWTP